MTIVCAWCSKEMGGEGEKAGISHGICRPCKERLMNQFRRTHVPFRKDPSIPLREGHLKPGFSA